MKTVLSLCAILLLSACQSNNSAELNQCAQQNYQCETSCVNSNTPETMSHQICNNECIETFNQCKVQAQQLTKSKTRQYQ
ncbi:hypothetical protein J8L98_15980 [Pseudoalteromonas sp. MMG013]|uniref:Orphan protein n=1 Tax=Pseudoalteromonas aurantia 208 TaxID=1314867 RepID=A0ABR9EF87_9GAMM|nr:MULTISPECIES: hypothetical protein [Pseudoalteromonas]MBE0369407.1 hypothetical protein [Pseudoalteromonas aurantia 208]MBQ4843950.1 hypothetical protein [Pseudoalteromonas sp. MMG005]MBQ4851166.1 hypothetical protein [Pseudoalteromonas sp. MMG012]MBQ4863187.1 hypothetical protein [Pseudoalteromonas sp. MMG013]